MHRIAVSTARLLTLAVLALLLAAAAVLPPAPAAAHSRCEVRWGSVPEDRPTGSADARVVDVRTGRHACFDRLVLDVEGDLRGHFVRYVGQVRHDGSGEPVAVRGGARLLVTATAPVVPTDAWWRPDGGLVDVTGYRTFRDLRFAGSFEGHTSVGLGVRARLPFRVLVLDGPGDGSRLVVDVAHAW